MNLNLYWKSETRDKSYICKKPNIMKYILITSICIFILGCKKEKTNSQNNSIHKAACKTLKRTILNPATGEAQSTMIYYYSNRLDSVVKFAPNRIITYKYEYLDAITRKVTPIYYSTPESTAYIMETIDSYGNIIESISVNSSGQTIAWGKEQYYCE